jgi:hypothetical protein
MTPEAKMIKDMVECSKYHYVMDGGELTFLQPVNMDSLNIKPDRFGVNRRYIGGKDIHKKIRFLIEDDTTPLEEQMEVLKVVKNSAIKPIMAVYSGNKSIHMIFQQKTPSSTTFEYKEQFLWLAMKIKELADEHNLEFVPDLSNSPVKKFRTPDIVRSETGKLQKLLFMNEDDNFKITMPTYIEPPPPKPLHQDLVKQWYPHKSGSERLKEALRKYPFNAKGSRNDKLCQFLGMLKKTSPELTEREIIAFVNAHAPWAKYENQQTIRYLWNKK